MTGERFPRLRLGFDRYGWLLVVGLLLVGTVCVAAGAAGLGDTRTTTVTDHDHVEDVTVDVSSAATVTEPNPLYETGTTLTDRDSYLLTAAPNATVVVRTAVDPSTELRYVHRVAVTYTVERGGTVVWSETEPLAVANGTSDGGAARTTTTVSVPAVAERLGTLRDAVGPRASVSAQLNVTGEYDTGRYAGTLHATSDLSVSDRWYGVAATEASRRHSDPTQRTVAVPTNTLDSWLLVGVGALVALVGVAGAVAKRRFDPADEDRLRILVDRARYEDWISRGHLPESFDRRVILVASLGDLGELAVDRNRRIVHDPSRDSYVVVDGEVVYSFDPFWSS